jgi:hypothetical protein
MKLNINNEIATITCERDSSQAFLYKITKWRKNGTITHSKIFTHIKELKAIINPSIIDFNGTGQILISTNNGKYSFLLTPKNKK